MPLTCDVGAAAALGVPAGANSYTVVYFASPQDAAGLEQKFGLTGGAGADVLPVKPG